MKKLYLHIGSHKTATTFLQGSLARNTELLDSLGILYPKAGQIYRAHFNLSREISSKEFADKPLEELENWSAFFAEAEASAHSNIIISAEEFSFLFDPSRLAPLRERFDLRVIYYLRSPDSFMESFYNQLVKDFGTREARTIETYMTEESLHFLDPLRVLAPWAKVFGDDAIRVRLFGKEYLPHGILADLLSVMGIDEVPAFAEPDESALQKVSLPPDALDYLRLANPWLTREEGHYSFVVKLVRLAQSHGDALQQTRAGLLSHKARMELRRRYRPSHAQVASRFLGMERSPFPPADAPPPPADFASREPEATPEIMGRVAAMILNMGES